MDISEISKRAFTPPTPRQVNATPAFQALAASSRVQNKGELPQAVNAPQDKEASGEELENAAKKVQEFVNLAASDIKFSIDEDSGQTVVKIIDRATEEVIRQMPSDDMLELAKALDKLQGLLIKQEA